MNSLPYDGVRALVLGNGPRIGQARQLLATGGATLAQNFSSSVTYVVIDRTVASNAPQVLAARRAAIPVVTTSELQAWPGMESLADARYAAPPVLMRPGPMAYYQRPTQLQRSSSGVDSTLVAFGWASLPLITGGVAMPFLAAHAAHRLRSRSQAMVAAGYAGALGLIMMTVVLSPGFPLAFLAFFVWLCCWLGGSVHAFLLYEKVNRDLAAEKKDDVVVSDPRNAQALAAIERRRNLREEARQLAKRDPVAARELGVGRPDRPSHYDDGGLVDVNNVPVSVLMTLPGITATVAEEIEAQRESNGPFYSTSELVVHTSLEPRFVDRLDEVALYVT